MREMVLNHASLGSPDPHTAAAWLIDATKGMAQLIKDGLVESTLRMYKPHNQISCLANWSLWDAFVDLQKRGAREEFILLTGITAKIPLLSDIGEDVKDRFLRCELKTLPSSDGEPLVLCAITNGIAIGFPSDSTWDKDQSMVVFNELLPDGNFEELSQTIDNLTRSAHAQPICDRHRADTLQEFTSFESLWHDRERTYASLIFAQDVESHLKRLNLGYMRRIVRVLERLNDAASEWIVTGEAIPLWRDEVRTESESVRNNPTLREARRFRSHDGVRRLFFLHADISESVRIHFRFDASLREVEIGYIGPHLPTKRFG